MRRTIRRGELCGPLQTKDMKSQEVKASSALKIPSDMKPATPMKSLQFRSIAPKAPPLPPPPPPPTLVKDAPPPSSGPLLVPAQNYALMQVAGQEGTFSLVPLPTTTSSPAGVSPSQRQQPISKSLKLPIPRYQPMRSRGTLDKASVSAIKLSSPTKVAMTPPVAARSSVQAKAPEVAKTPTEPANEPLRLSGEAGAGAEAKRGHPHLGTLMPKLEPSELPASSSQSSIDKTSQAITVLSPTLFGKPVQLLSTAPPPAPPPSGKLPILPYARVRDSLLSSTPNTAPVAPPLAPPTTAPAPPPPAPAAANQNTPFKPLPPPLIQGQPTAKRRRGRRRKTTEDVLALEARRKRALSFFRRRAAPEKPSPATPPNSRKYRSIRPKPAPALTSLALPQPAIQLTSSSTSPPSPLKSPSPISLTFHPCPTCGRCFQHRPHLLSHMASHLLTNHSKALVAPLVTDSHLHHTRAARVRSRSLALPHPRPRPSLRCLFCQKAFSYVGVFFSHLRELHRVILTVEPSIIQHEEHTPGEAREEETEDPVELQIKCGRCQAVTPTFSDMQLHLFYVHGQGAGAGPGLGPAPVGLPVPEGRTVEEELVKHAAHYWRQLNERRSLRRCGRCQEVFLSVSRLKRHACCRLPGVSSPRLSLITGRGRGFHCFLCSVVLDSKQEVLTHWKGRHHCENPPLLWEALNGGTDSMNIS